MIEIAEGLKKLMERFDGSIVRLDLRDERLKAAYDRKEAAAVAKATKAAEAVKRAEAAKKKKLAKKKN